MNEERILMHRNRHKLEKLKESLSEFPLDLSVVFGSQISDKATKISDLDIAIRFNPNVLKEEKLRLMDRITVAVTKCTGFEAVDLVDLDEVGAEIGYKALKEGKVIIGNKEEANKLEARFLLQKLDFAPVKEEWRKAMTERIEKDEYGKL